VINEISDSILEMVLDGVIVTTGHKYESMYRVSVSVAVCSVDV